MKVFTSRPVARALNVAALAGACSALALSAGAPTALADCQKCEAPDAAALQHFLPAATAPTADTRPYHFMPIDVGPLAHRPVVKPFVLGQTKPAMPPADREPSEMPTLLPPATALPAATSPSATAPVPSTS